MKFQILIIAGTKNQNTALKKLPVSSETSKTNYITKSPVQDPLVTKIGNFFEKFAVALGQHMTTLGNQIFNNIIDAMDISDNLKIDKEEVSKKCSHSSKAKASKENEKNSRRKWQKLRNNFYRGKSQIQGQRKVREVSRSGSPEDDEQCSSCNDDNESFIAIRK